MADVERLVLEVDSSVELAKNALAQLAGDVDKHTRNIDIDLARIDKASARAGTAFAGLSNAMVAASNQARPLGTALDQVTVQELRVARAVEQMARTMEQAASRTSVLTAEQIAAARSIQAFAQATSGIQGELGHLSSGLGGARMAQMELMHVVTASTDAFAAGIPLQRIFAMEIGRVGQAASAAGGAIGGVGAFMASGWGLAVTAATAILGPLIFRLFDTEDAAAKAGKATSDFGAKNVEIGRYVDVLTGHLKTQNAVLIQNAILKRQAQIDQSHFEIAGAVAQARRLITSSGFTERMEEDPFTPGQVNYVKSRDRDLLSLDRMARDPSVGIRQLDAAIGKLAARRPDLMDLRRKISDLAATAENSFANKGVAVAEIALFRGVSGAPDQYARALQAATGDFPSGFGPPPPKPPRGGGGGGSGGRSGGARSAPADNYLLARDRLDDALPLSLDSFVPAPPDWDKMLDQMQRLGLASFDLKQTLATLPDIGHILPPDVQERLERFSLSFKEDLARGLTDAIFHAKNFGDVMIQVLKRIAEQMVESGILNFLTGGQQGMSFGTMSSSLGSMLHFAGGGDPPVGRPYLVGEHGPELRIDRTPSTIIPNHMLRGAARGGSAEPQLIVVQVDKSALFDVHVDSRIGAHAPAIAGAAVAQVMKIANRRGING